MSDIFQARIEKAEADIRELGGTPPTVVATMAPEDKLKTYEKHLKELRKAKKDEAELGEAAATSLPSDKAIALMQKQMQDLHKQLQDEREQRQKDNKVLDDIAAKLGAQSLVQTGAGTESILQNPEFIAAMDRIIHGKRNESTGLISERYVNPSDRIAPVTFFATKKFGMLRFRVEGGVRIEPPNGSEGVKFTYNFRNIDPQTLRITTRGHFTTESKSMYEWIKKHEKYGVEIFENPNEADKMSANSDWADARDRHMTILRQRTDDHTISAALQLGIKFNGDTHILELQRLVAERLANKEFEQRTSERAEFLKERQADALLMDRVAGVKAMSPTA